MATNEISAIRDLIMVLNDGVKFYTDAKTELKGSGYEAVFQEMIDVRQNALVRLQPLLYAREGETENDQTVGGALRQAYTDLMAKIKSNKTKAYIVQLEELEDRTLVFVKKAQAEAVSVDFTIALNYILISMQECHNRMRSLKRNVA